MERSFVYAFVLPAFIALLLAAPLSTMVVGAEEVRLSYVPLPKPDMVITEVPGINYVYFGRTLSNHYLRLLKWLPEGFEVSPSTIASISSFNDDIVLLSGTFREFFLSRTQELRAKGLEVCSIFISYRVESLVSGIGRPVLNVGLYKPSEDKIKALIREIEAARPIKAGHHKPEFRNTPPDNFRRLVGFQFEMKGLYNVSIEYINGSPTMNLVPISGELRYLKVELRFYECVGPSTILEISAAYSPGVGRITDHVKKDLGLGSVYMTELLDFPFGSHYIAISVGPNEPSSVVTREFAVKIFKIIRAFMDSSVAVVVSFSKASVNQSWGFYEDEEILGNMSSRPGSDDLGSAQGFLKLEQAILGAGLVSGLAIAVLAMAKRRKPFIVAAVSAIAIIAIFSIYMLSSYLNRPEEPGIEIVIDNIDEIRALGPKEILAVASASADPGSRWPGLTIYLDDLRGDRIFISYRENPAFRRIVDGWLKWFERSSGQDSGTGISYEPLILFSIDIESEDGKMYFSKVSVIQYEPAEVAKSLVTKRVKIELLNTSSPRSS